MLVITCPWALIHKSQCNSTVTSCTTPSIHPYPTPLIDLYLFIHLLFSPVFYSPSPRLCPFSSLPYYKRNMLPVPFAVSSPYHHPHAHVSRRGPPCQRHASNSSCSLPYLPSSSCACVSTWSTLPERCSPSSEFPAFPMDSSKEIGLSDTLEQCQLTIFH